MEQLTPFILLVWKSLLLSKKRLVPALIVKWLKAAKVTPSRWH